MSNPFLDIDQIIEKLKRATASWEQIDRSRLTKAIILARTKHAGQTYNPTNEYAIHPLRAALSLIELSSTEPDVVLSAILHDTIEDTEVTEEELRQEFGDRVSTIVKLVSHRLLDETPIEEKIAAKKENLAEIKRGPIEVRLVKCADLLDQMRNWKYLTKDSPFRAKLLRYLEEAQSYALPLAEETNEKFAEEMRKELQWYYVHAI